MLRLASATPDSWFPVALARLPETLVDHDHCEKKAASTAVGLLSLVAALLLVLFQGSDPGATLTSLLVADGLAKVFRILAIGTGLVAALAALRWADAECGRAEFFVCLIGAVLGACLTGGGQRPRHALHRDRDALDRRLPARGLPEGGSRAARRRSST